MRMLILFLAVLSLVGCTAGYKTRIGAESYAPVPKDKVIVLNEFPEEGTYKEIGLVSAHGSQGVGRVGMDVGQFTTDSMVYGKLQKAAADLGADAVVVGPAAMNYRGTTSSSSYTNGTTSINQTGRDSYQGSYSGTTYYNPGHAVYGLDVQGVAIRYNKDSR